MAGQKMKSVNQTMHDYYGNPVKVKVEAFSALGLTIEGYGDLCSKTGQGSPLVLAFNSANELCAYIWADINKEDPTHIINLKGARDSARLETSRVKKESRC